MFNIGDPVTVKQEIIENGWPEFQGKIGKVVRVYDTAANLFKYAVKFDSTYRESGEFGFDEEELDAFGPQV